MKKLFLSLALLAPYYVMCDAPAKHQKAVAPAPAIAPAPKAQEAKKATSAKTDKEMVSEILNDSTFTPEFYENMKVGLQQIAAQIDPKNTDKASKLLYDSFMKEFKGSMEKFVDFYLKNFNSAEIKKIYEWYRTEEAKKLAKKTPEFSQLSMNVSQEALMKSLQEVQSQVAKEDKKSEAKKAPEKKAEPKKEAATGKKDVNPTKQATSAKKVATVKKK